jgi:DNA-binding NarL/FixJ family response regulator
VTAVSERVLREGNGAAGAEDAHVRLLWLKGSQQEVVPLGLHAASRATRIHRGRGRPAGGEPSAVVCFPSAEEDVAPEVEGARALAPNAVVLVFAPSPSLRLARAALGAGAGGLLHGGMSPEQVLRALRVALQGETVLPRGLLAEWVAEQRPPDLGVLLSARQRETLGLLAEGSTNAEIAGRLFLSESTIKQHLRAAYKALGVRNRREAAALSRRWQRGWTSIRP